MCNAEIISLPSHKGMIPPTALASYSQLYLKNRFTKNIWKSLWFKFLGFFITWGGGAYNYTYSTSATET